MNCKVALRWFLAEYFLIFVVANDPFSRYRIKDSTKKQSTRLETTSRSAYERKSLNVAIILPQDALNIRSLRGCITREMNKINSGKWNFLKDFNLDRFVTTIKNWKSITIIS